MTTYTTNIGENSKDQATFTNPFTNVMYRRGNLQVRVEPDELTGDKAMAVMEDQMAVIPATTHHDFPAIIDPTHIAIGPFISALGDNLFFDAVLGVGTSAVFGYNHPAIFPKLQKLGSILPGFMGAGTDYFFNSRHGAPVAQDLARLMTDMARTAYGTEYRMNFANAGTEANENALKVAMFNKFRQIKKILNDEQYGSMCEQLGIKAIEMPRDSVWSNYPFYLLAFKGAFHGRTATSNTLSLSKRRQKEGYQAVPYVVHVPYGKAIDFDEVIDATPIQELIEEKRLKSVMDSGKIPADLLSAIIIEPIQGEGGYIIPSREFLASLDSFLDKYRSRGLCLISDEVQTGLFRTGKFTGMQNWYEDHPNLKPDIMSFAKPLHVGGVLIQSRLLEDWPPGKFSGTWAEGNLLGIAVAVYTLEELKNTDPCLGRSYPENCIEAGKYLRQAISGMGERLEKKFPGTGAVSNVRGLGQMNAFDLPSHDLVNQAVHESFLHGLHILGTGERSIRVFGTVDQRSREADILVKILEDVLEQVLSHSKKEPAASLS